MPDLSLDFDEYKTMPEEAIIAWAKSLGLELETDDPKAGYSAG